jgi:hypothetical protein
MALNRTIFGAALGVYHGMLYHLPNARTIGLLV